MTNDPQLGMSWLRDLLYNFGAPLLECAAIGTSIWYAGWSWWVLLY